MVKLNDDPSCSSSSDLSKDNISICPQVSGYSFCRYCLLACQMVLPMLVNFVYLPLTLLLYLCLLPDEPQRGTVILSLLLYSGFANILQASIGIKFPVMMSPSRVFISGTVLFFESTLWESYSAGDLYAMGPSLRFEENIIRTNQLRGILVVNGILSMFICGAFWRLPIELPSATIAATLISVSWSNIDQLLGQKETSVLSIMAFMLSLVFYLIGNLQMPFSNKIINKLFRETLNIFKQFSVLLSSVIIIAISINSEQGEKSILERAIGSHHWYSFNLPFEDRLVVDFTLPQFSLKCTVLLPVLCSQFVTSYCCYLAVSREKGRYLKAMLVESALTVVSAAVGISIPLAVDSTSIGLAHMTKVRNTEPLIITGGLLILCSILVKIVAFFTFASYPLLCGLNVFIYGQLLTKVFTEIKDKRESMSAIALPVVCSWLLSSLPVDAMFTNIPYAMAAFTLTSPTLVTFCLSLIMTFADKPANLMNKRTADV